MRVLKKNAIKAYKVFNSDWTCRDFQYEVGEEYKCTGEIKPCKNGFHCCLKLVDCFNYYSFDPKNKVAIVEVWGTVKQKDNKLCASNIKIIKKLDWHTVLDLSNTGKYNTGAGNSGRYNTGYYNSGEHNSDDLNSGNRNSGGRNSGDCNSGGRNSGGRNSGYCNSGSWNSGCWNSGGRNSGDCNSGNCNSGSRNSGNWNSGNWNSGDWNSGFFNTSKQEIIYYFNKPTQNKNIKFPTFLYFKLTKWVCADDMTDEEKAQHPEYSTTGGFLEHLTYKEAFRESFEHAKKQSDWPTQLRQLKAIPNFDANIFYEISGIRPEELEA